MVGGRVRINLKAQLIKFLSLYAWSTTGYKADAISVGRSGGVGGKSPCIVNKDADIKKTAARIVWAKSVNSGQTCVAPDYLLVHKDVKDKLISEMIKAKKRFFGDNMLESDSFGKIIRPQAFESLVELFKDQNILEGGNYDAEKQKNMFFR